MSEAQNEIWYARLAQMRDEAEEIIHGKLKTFLAQLGNDAASIILTQGVTTDPYVVIAESIGREITDMLVDDALGLIGESYKVTDDVWQLGLGDTLPDFASEMGQFGERMDGVANSMRNDIQRTLNEFAGGDLTKGDAADKLKGQIGEDWRARRTARTECSIITNSGQTRAAAQAGHTEMHVVDGAGCGWTYHNDPDIADGSTRTIPETSSWPIAHPNCLRAFALPDEPPNIPPFNPLGEEMRIVKTRQVRNMPERGHIYRRMVPRVESVAQLAAIRTGADPKPGVATSGFMQTLEIDGPEVQSVTTTPPSDHVIATDGITGTGQVTSVKLGDLDTWARASGSSSFEPPGGVKVRQRPAPEFRMPGDDEMLDEIPIDGEVRYFDAFFAFANVVDEYNWIVQPSAFASGSGANFITNHQWSQLPLGAGRVQHVDAAAGLMGPFRASAMEDDEVKRFIRAYNVQVKAGIKPEVSMGFFVEEWMEWDEMNDEQRETGADIIVTKADLVEVSFVFRGAVPGTSLSLRTSSATIHEQTESSHKDDCCDPQWLEAARKRNLAARHTLARSRAGRP